ncbi:MAG: hypothetical protein ACKV2V_22375 [Blastocatellia bacterium]
MNRQDRKRLEMYTRVREFGQKFRGEFPEGSRCFQLLADLDRAMTSINHAEHTRRVEAGNVIDESNERNELRDSLKSQLAAISRTAKGIALERKGFDRKFRVPSRGADQDLVAVAQAIVAAVIPVQGDFIHEEMPADFLTELQETITAFTQVIERQGGAREEKSSATDSLNGAFQEATRIVRKMDAPVRNRFQGNPAVIAKWEKASRIERPARNAAAGEADGGETAEKPA